MQERRSFLSSLDRFLKVVTCIDTGGALSSISLSIKRAPPLRNSLHTGFICPLPYINLGVCIVFFIYICILVFNVFYIETCML